ncbi:MAG: sigma-70 family RNA polymerase sigma factor [Phycisphaerae bacterium]
MTDVTRILTAIERGDAQAADELLPIVYGELRRLAGQLLRREQPGQTLQATALVHEAYLRLVGSGDPGWEGRRHFFASAAEAMRRILVESARRKKSLKRGGGRNRANLTEIEVSTPGLSVDLIALDEALSGLAEHAPRQAELVKLRYFAGLTVAQAARILGISCPTAHRDWAYARSWLLLRLSEGRQRSQR